jgi:asparagine synthase (glutamine-hydrolysing)
MCGIAGILGSAADGDRDQRVRRMTSALRHRGPDDEGFFEDPSVALGFRRLAVIDLETGQQPIELENRRLVIVLNGEIYNFRELRRELEGRGHRFRSSGDVEVVLRLWAEQGASCLSRLNGMFALAVWDGDRGTLCLARDRFGIKPLFVCREHDTVAFASEMRSLAAGGFPADRRLDRVALRHYLAYGFLPPDGSPWLGVKALAPATVTEIGVDGHERTTSYWQPPPSTTGGSAAAAADRVRDALEGAVARQLVADVPVGVFLSGGLDSSTVSALAHRHLSGPLRTFSVGFGGAGAVSELPYARRVADHLGSDHHELMMDPDTVADDLEVIVDGLDAPLADPTAIPTWYMSRLARERVTVALSGEGADEVFGGYARQRYDVTVDRLGAVGRRALPVAMRLAGRPVSTRLRHRLRMKPGLRRQLDWGRVFPASKIDAMVDGPAMTEDELHACYGDLAARWHSLAMDDPVNGRLTTDREVFLPADLLPKVDRMSMAHSLEVRVPFLDNEVIDLVLALPGSLKQSIRRDKILLRRTAAGLLPSYVANRRKLGFEVPIGAWLRDALRPAVGDWLSPATVRRHGVLHEGEVSPLVNQHLAGTRDHGRALWSLMVLSRWVATSGGT